jgi:tetratricopeptide (TPR) repeat protein
VTIDQAVELLELEPPADLRDIQLARRKLAKRWHPDRASAAQRHVHERQMKSINSAADLLETRVNDAGPITAMDVRVSADVYREQQREAGERAYQAAQEEPKTRRAGTSAERSIVYRYVRSASFPEWGVGSIVDVRFSGEGDDVQRWAQVQFGSGSHLLPVDNLIYVDFRQNEKDADRADRFLAAARDAVAEGKHELAIKRLVYARNSDPRRAEILSLLAHEYFRVERLREAGRAVRDWIRAEPDLPAAYRLAARIYAAMGAHDLADDMDREARAAEKRLRGGRSERLAA